MTTHRLAKRLTALKKSRKARQLAQVQKHEPRRLNLEALEDRRVMALTLVAVIPNSGVFLNDNDTLNVAPKEITFRFAQGNAVAPATIAGGFQVIRGGPDLMLGTADDVTVTPGFIGLADTSREVIMRFAQNLPDDAYRVTLIGTGATPLKDTGGNAFNNGADQQINFRLDLGEKVSAVVPQPITRDLVTRVLSQDRRAIEVYFDQNQFAPAVVQTPGYYRLIDTATGQIRIPDDATAPVVYDPAQKKATLRFATDIPAGTFKLEVGVTYESDDRISLARHIANSMSSPLQAFIGDNVTLAAASQANDVDLYRFELRAAAAINVTATPGASLDAVIRVFDSTGAPVGGVVNGGGAGAAEALSTAVLPAGTYYVGISSAANTAYNAATGTGAAGGTTTGSYALRVTFSDLGFFSDAN